jgi:predicted amidohydrolase YtcJ
MEPTTIYINGDIHTLGGSGRVSALAITQGRVSAVGPTAEIDRLAGPSTRRIDLQGRTAIPALNDSHIHLTHIASELPNVQLLECRSIAEVLVAIAERTATTPPGQWVLSSSLWHEGLLAERRPPNRFELDTVSPNHPVYLARGGHVGVANSAALALAGIDQSTPDPRSGVIARTSDGEPTGLLLEHAKRLITDLLPPPDPDLQRHNTIEMMKLLNARGVTTITDPGLDDTAMARYRSIDESGEATLRSFLLFRFWNLADVERVITEYADFNKTGHLVRFLGMKYAIDGGIEGAYLHEPYCVVPGEQEREDYRGVLRLPPGGMDEMKACLEAGAKAGLHYQLHAVGDATIDVLNDLCADVASRYPLEPMRWSLCHDMLASPEQLRRQFELGLNLTVQVHPVLVSSNMMRWWGPERSERSTPIASARQAGLILGGGTDAPAAPIDPWAALRYMVDRETLAGFTLGLNERISFDDALRMMTAGSAYSQFAEHELGTLEPGMLADMAVLRGSLDDLDPAQISEVQVDATILEGTCVYDAVGNVAE